MDWKYLLRLWILTLLCGPIVFISKCFLANPSASGSSLFDFFEFYYIMGAMSAIFSLPTLLFAVSLFTFLENHNLKHNYIKVILTSTFVIGIFTTLKILGGTIAMDIALSYSIPAIIIGLSFKLKQNNNQESLSE